MSILYLLTAPRPIVDGTDAVFQEVEALRSAFQGDAINLFPRIVPTSSFPRSLYGLHKIRELRKLENRHEFNHLYYPVLYAFPVLRLLRNPTVSTIAASLDRDDKPADLARLKALHRIVVSNDRDADVLEAWGLSNYSVIPPGIDASGLTPGRMALGDELTLLMASAPWSQQQFDLKGIDALLEATARLPHLKLILLWRGLLFDELTERVERHGIGDRIEIVNHKVDVNAYLNRAHATVLLTKRADVVKSYPHSLIESLLAGKPVLISDKIPMADYVRKHQCGVVVEDVSVRSLTAAIEALRGRYEELTRCAAQIGPDAFSMQAFIENHRRLYGL